MQVIKDAKKIDTDDFFYDLFDAGHVKPEDFLDAESAKQVREAMDIIELFEYTLVKHDLISFH